MARLILDPGAQPIVGCYSMHLYCRYQHNPIGWGFPHEFNGKSEASCSKQARSRGWILHHDGYATCPDCAEVLTGKKKPVEKPLPEGMVAVDIYKILGTNPRNQTP